MQMVEAVEQTRGLLPLSHQLGIAGIIEFPCQHPGLLAGIALFHPSIVPTIELKLKKENAPELVPGRSTQSACVMASSSCSYLPACCPRSTASSPAACHRLPRWSAPQRDGGWP